MEVLAEVGFLWKHHHWCRLKYCASASSSRDSIPTGFNSFWIVGNIWNLYWKCYLHLPYSNWESTNFSLESSKYLTNINALACVCGCATRECLLKLRVTQKLQGKRGSFVRCRCWQLAVTAVTFIPWMGFCAYIQGHVHNSTSIQWMGGFATPNDKSSIQDDNSEQNEPLMNFGSESRRHSSITNATQ